MQGYAVGMQRHCSSGANEAMKGRQAKPRAVQGELRQRRHEARNQLLTWFREKDGTVPLKEIARRLKRTFDVQASLPSLSNYYHDHYAEIVQAPKDEDKKWGPKTIGIRIEVPPDCRFDVSTSEGATDTGAAS